MMKLNEASAIESANNSMEEGIIYIVTTRLCGRKAADLYKAGGRS